MMNFLYYLLNHSPLFYLNQSLWRDEAFSYFMARPNIFKIIINTANDFNPPFYYLILHYWLNIAGKSDEILRLLSFFAHLLTSYIAYLFAKKIFSKKFAFFVLIFTFLNPMLLYYAFELRMYSFYAFFTILSLYFFWSKNWKLYTFSSILGLYTHSFFPLIIFSFLIIQKVLKNINKKNFLRITKPFIFFIPWIPVIIIQFVKSKNSWIFPVDFRLIKSVLGNLFINFEGTPGYGWDYTAFLSIFMLFFFYLGFKRYRKLAQLFLIPIFFPLFIILSFSLFRRPIYVNRYLIFITVFEIMGICLGIWSIKKKLWRLIASVLWLILIICINLIITPYHKKTDFKTTFFEINKYAKTNDYIFTKTPLSFLESIYYFKDEKKVFVYNPNNIHIPDYIGINVVFPNISKNFLPKYPSRTFMIEDNGSFELLIEK